MPPVANARHAGSPAQEVLANQTALSVDIGVYSGLAGFGANRSPEPKVQDFGNGAGATQFNGWFIFKGLPALFQIAPIPFAKQVGCGLVPCVCRHGAGFEPFQSARDSC
jgi:hypothetical protein